ncbi:MAG TPA: thioredoxin family protein [bacterium]|nr:thioredoxin family protein [bacterium]
MAVSSTMLPLGSKVPDFRVLDMVNEKWRTPADFFDYPLLLVMFICRHCPYVLHVKDQLVRLGVDYIPKKVGIIAISSNDAVKYPDDAPAHLKEMTQELKFNFPLAYDESQEVAKAFRAACTPEFYLFDQKRELIYRGQLDDSRPKNDIPVTGKDLRAALDAALSGQNVSAEQKPGIGCNIKWKPGNEPDYFSH